MALAITHSTVATLPDETGAEVNAAEWNDDHVIAGGTAGSILYVSSTGTITEDNANLKWGTTAVQAVVDVEGREKETLRGPVVVDEMDLT